MDAILYGALCILVALALDSQRRLRRLKMEMQQMDKGLHELRVHANVAHERLKSEILSHVDGRLRSKDGGAVFNGGMSVGEVIKAHPHAAAVMAQFNLGGCSACNISDNHILSDAARDYGVNIDELLASLNGLFNGTTRIGEDQIGRTQDGALFQIESPK